MSTANDTPALASSAEASTRPHRFRSVLGTGLVAVLGAVAATTLTGAVARAAGVELAVASEPIPLSGVAFVTAVFTSLGVLMALAFCRWSARPGVWFVRTTVALTAVSLVPPVLVDAGAATTVTLAGLHLLAAAVVIPPLTRAAHPRGAQSRSPERRLT